MRISDWSSHVCSSDLLVQHRIDAAQARVAHQLPPRHHHLAEELAKGDQRLERLHCGAAHVGEDAGKRRARVGPYLRGLVAFPRSEEHTSELQSLMRISYAVFCLKKNTSTQTHNHTPSRTTDRTLTCLTTHQYSPPVTTPAPSQPK